MDAVGSGLDHRLRLSRGLVGLDPREVLSFALHAVPFFVAAGVYEILRSVIGIRGEIHVGDLYALEEWWFPVRTADGIQALSAVVARATHPLLDVVCGVTYLLFLPEFFGVAAYLFFRNRPKMLQVSLGFLLANVLGWAVWLVYPAAPPWYVDLYGTGPALLDAASNPAGLSRLDALLGLPIASTFYSKSANVFGAMPSLHVAYATFIALVAWPLGGRLRVATVLFAISVAYSAVYLRHHYLLDVLAGWALALVTWWLVGRVLRAARYEAYA